MKHLAIIADGNRRWAAENDLPTKAGYVQGLTAIERCCDWAVRNDVQYLTVYCFSTENWSRPVHEVNQLMDLARWYFEERREWYIAAGIKVCFAGRRDRLAPDILEKLDRMEEATDDGNMLQLTICVDYGGRDEIVNAVASGAQTEEEISEALYIKAPDPDIIVRTGGEMRLSNFLLWQSAYAELLFLQTKFPAIDDVILDAIMAEYNCRKRNFGS